MASVSVISIISLTLALLAPIATAVRYLALGDSYAAGVGAGGDGVAGGDPDFDRCCFRRTNAYPFVVSRSLSTTFFDFRACSGANATGLGNTVLASQLRRPPPSIDFVTVTIGGNDIGFTNVVVNCLTPAVNTQGCLSAVAEARRRAETELGPKLRELDARIGSIYPRSKIAFTGYPLRYPTTELFFFENAVFPSFNVRSSVNRAITDLNNVIRANVRSFIPVSFEGHDICRLITQSFQSTISPDFALRQAIPVTPQCSVQRRFSSGYGDAFHPNEFGHLTYSRTILQWFRQN